jgi:hypothetical protein
MYLFFGLPLHSLTNARQNDHVRALQHPTHGYQLAAAMLALPRAFQTWSLLGFGAQLILSAMDLADSTLVLVVCAASAFILILLSAMASILSREPTQPPGCGDSDGCGGTLVRLLRSCFGSKVIRQKECPA